MAGLRGGSCWTLLRASLTSGLRTRSRLGLWSGARGSVETPIAETERRDQAADHRRCRRVIDPVGAIILNSYAAERGDSVHMC